MAHLLMPDCKLNREIAERIVKVFLASAGASAITPVAVKEVASSPVAVLLWSRVVTPNPVAVFDSERLPIFHLEEEPLRLTISGDAVDRDWRLKQFAAWMRDRYPKAKI